MEYVNDNTVLSIFNSLSILKTLLEPVTLRVIAVKTAQSSYKNPLKTLETLSIVPQLFAVYSEVCLLAWVQYCLLTFSL